MTAVERFYQQHKAQWEELEALLATLGSPSGRVSMEQLQRLDSLYWHVGRDVAWAETHAPESRLAEHLRHLLARAHSLLHGQDEKRSLRQWSSDLVRGFPLAVHRLSGAMLLSALVFLVGIALGVVLILVSEDAAGLLLSPGMIEAVQSGKMWTEGLLNVMPSSIISAGIATNNITVTFAAFAFGIFFGLGSLYIMLMNGLLLGAAAAYCVQGGIGYAFFSFVSGHGVVELSVIVLSGGAGWALGLSLLAPGRLPRGEAIRQTAKEGMMILFAAVPLLLFAGFIEGYLSPAEALPGWAKMIIGVVLGALLWTWILTQGRNKGNMPLRIGQHTTRHSMTG